MGGSGAYQLDRVIPRARRKRGFVDIIPVDAEDLALVLVPIPYRKVLDIDFRQL
jgi:hypothetical protein